MSLSAKNNFHNSIFWGSALIFLITSYFSIGYYHGDEHYQIIEFAGVKLGTNGFLDMAWEYKEELRSSFQPTIGFVIIKVLQLFNISDPYSQLFIVRAITAVLALFSIRFFVTKTCHFFTNKASKKFYYVVSYLLWFIPFLSVRFSSETWAALLFLPAVGIMLGKEIKGKDFILIGLLGGFSFLCRYQMAICIVISFLWLLSIKRISILQLGKAISATLGVIVLGALLDTWFYEKFTIPFVNYFKAAFIDSDSPNFGSSEWSLYLESFLSSPGSIIGVSLVASFLILIITKPKNLIVWLVIVFTFIHSLIPHKEVRFLFPIAFLFPFVLAYGFNYLNTFYQKHKLVRYSTYLWGVLFLVVNTTGLIIMAVKPAGVGRMAISKYIHDHSQGEAIQLIHCNWSNPYDPWDGLPSKFYSEPNLINTRISSPCELNDSLIQPEKTVYFVARKADLNRPECALKTTGLKITLVKESIPSWIAELNEQYQGFNNQVILNLYKLEN